MFQHSGQADEEIFGILCCFFGTNKKVAIPIAFTNHPFCSRLECSVCGHTWFQSRDRLMTVNNGFEIVPLPENDLNRIKLNIEEGKSPKFQGEIKLYVGNIAFSSREEDIYEMFSKIGEVGDVALVRDEEGRNRGFGFVTMRYKADGEKAVADLDGVDMNGRNIAVRESNN